VIVNALDLGSSHPWSAPVVGQDTGTLLIEGLEYAIWPRGSTVRQQQVVFNLVAWQALGGASAQTRQATLYLLKQVEELASNRDLQPCYIQWNATAQPSAPLNSSELHDGWYVIDSFAPTYMKYVVAGIVECRMSVTEVAPAAPRRVSVAYQGAALSTNFSGTATNLLSLPVGSTAEEASFTRAGGEGSIPSILSPVASPEPAVLSTTLSQIFKGGVHIFDSIA
jgi:hypothetical protein